MDSSIQRSVPTASTTYSTCCGRTNRPLDSADDMSDTAGDTLRSRFARSMLSWSPSRFRLLLLSRPSVLSHSFRRRRAVVSCPNSHSDAAPMSKYRIPPHVPSCHARPSSLSPGHASLRGTSTPTHGPASPSTSPMYRAYARKRAFFDEMMHGIPMSSVAPLGSFAAGSASRIVSAELFRLSVDVLVEDTTLPCFSCASEGGGAFAFGLIVPPFSSCAVLLPALVGRGGLVEGVPGVERTTDFLVVVDLFEIVERIEVVETVRFATGLVFPDSADDGGGRLLTDEVVLDVTEGGRLGMRGVDVPVVRTLVVETAEAAESRRCRVTLLAVSSDRAVSNAVEFSLIDEFDSVDAGRDAADEGGRSVDGPAAPLRIVDVVERVDLTEAATDLTDAATDFGRGKRSAVECSEGVLGLRTLAVDMLLLGTGLGLGESGDFARAESATLPRADGDGVECAGVSFESGRRLPGESGTRRKRVVVVTCEAVVTRELVEWVLRARDRTDAAEVLSVSGGRLLVAVLRVECILTVSDSSAFETGPFRTVRRPPRAVDVGVVGPTSSVSSLSSNSVAGVRAGRL